MHYLMRWKYALLPALVMIMTSCSDELAVVNPNEPEFDVLTSEEGVNRFAIGMYNALDLDEPFHFLWMTQVYHETMGDALVTPWGNWQYRWVAQVDRVILDDGTVLEHPEGAAQPQEIRRINNRQLAADAAVVQEWGSMYYLNNQANTLLEGLETADLGVDAELKRRGYTAWAHWWKGYAYSRIGSMYDQGLIIDEPGETHGNFVDRTEIIAEANRQLDLAIQHADGIERIADRVVPAMHQNIPTQESLTRMANTLKARNLLVNTRQEEMTDADWQQILALTEQGLQPENETDVLILRTDDTTYPRFWHIYNAAYGGYGWHRVSERLMQDVYEEDARRERFVQTAGTWGTAGRGVPFNSTWMVNDYYATPTSTEPYVRWYLVSPDENTLMRAEALWATGQGDLAADLVDQVRESQGANLSAIDATADVWEEIRRERRIGLFLRGLAFYDARRWGVIDPVAQGGGREDAVVVLGNDENGVAIFATGTMDYNFLPYWPVPDEELTFNPSNGNTVVGQKR